MGDNFDDMSNDQLRLKLLEYGLSNMPVTSTTRKVLIKKLRNHISTNGAGGGGGGGAKARRETIALTKYSSDEDSEPVGPSLSQNAGTKKASAATKKDTANRRATIAGGGGATAKPPKFISASQPTPKVTEALPPEPPGSASKRRSGRVTPVKDKDVASSSTAKAAAPKVPAILEDSDDDMIPLTQLSQRERKSKSPSLSRAEMLTTSYIHQVEVSAPEPIVEEMEVDVPEVGKNTEEMDVIVLDDDDDNDLLAATMPPPQQPAKPAAVKESFSQTTSETRRTVTTATGTMTDTRKDSQREERIFAEPPVPLKYGTTERTVPKPTFASPSVRSSMSTTSTVREEPGGPRYDPSDSPYLSEFTKRLSRLRAEAAHPSSGRDSPSRRTMFEGGSSSSLRSTYARDAYETSSSSSRYRAGRQTLAPMSTTTGRRTATETASDDVRSSVRQKLLALDRKYSIRKVFYSIIIVLVVVFLFVFFFL